MPVHAKLTEAQGVTAGFNTGESELSNSVAVRAGLPRTAEVVVWRANEGSRGAGHVHLAPGQQGTELTQGASWVLVTGGSKGC